VRTKKQISDLKELTSEKKPPDVVYTIRNGHKNTKCT